MDDRTQEAQEARTEQGRAGDQGADTSGGRIEEANNARPAGASDVARSQLPDRETEAQEETSQAGADSTRGLASHDVEPFDEETPVQG
jgi:hypothetical protein